MSSGPPPAPVLVAAVVLLIAGVAAAIAHDDHRASTPPLSSAQPTSVTSSAPSTSTSNRTSSSTAPTTTTATTSVRPAVGSPEAAANGLWAAYTASNRTAAQRFASDDVIRVLFEEPYDGEPGTFHSCRPEPDGFECRYAQPSTQYLMTVRADPTGSFKVVELTVSPST